MKNPVRAEITVPGSKSITNRALILAALGEGEVTLKGALWSEDTQIMTEALKKLGFEVRVEPDPEEYCNRAITVKGLNGKIPNASATRKPLELFVGNAGTAARFLAAIVCLGEGLYHLSGVPRMHERPQSSLFKALRELGYRIETEYGNDRLPAFIEGSGPVPGGKCKVSIEKSSQFASALLLCAKAGEWAVKVVGENAEESPYVAMTSKMMEVFPHRGGTFQIEPDASSGSYFAGAGSLSPENKIRVRHWPNLGWQVDERFYEYIQKLNRTEAMRMSPVSEEFSFSRVTDLGDSIMTGIVMAPFNRAKIRFRDLARLRVQECDRVTALQRELTKCGAKVVEE
ncbi:MAG: hypothetical protein ACREE6_00325, partial [Limisphaerales bacterium]